MRKERKPAEKRNFISFRRVAMRLCNDEAEAAAATSAPAAVINDGI